ncbi:hypothetical protein NDU88_002524 [Pleurodeles waltl]|uniref:Uncharacterized protein n=1 Tax=Pleurodeles waltl TaxID=8319 RepID=A0AAV7Q9M4_PLEWA|nr:hypothetical protein NDU88_002524 [Pleurodeles waltl]
MSGQPTWPTGREARRLRKRLRLQTPFLCGLRGATSHTGSPKDGVCPGSRWDPLERPRSRFAASATAGDLDRAAAAGGRLGSRLPGGVPG